MSSINIVRHKFHLMRLNEIKRENEQLAAFYVLLTYIAGYLLGENLDIDIVWQAIIICITLLCLVRAFVGKSELKKYMILLAIFNTGIVRSAWSEFSILSNGFYEKLYLLIEPSKNKLVETMGIGLSDIQKELICGIVLGRGSGVTDIGNWPHFLKSGMSHLLVASGAQVSLSIFPLILLAEYAHISSLARKIIFMLAGVLLFCLLLIVGMEPSILRAVTACYLYLFARILNRKSNPLNIIYTTALIWLWMNPSLLRNAGFQLSYSASWGLIYIYPRLRLMMGQFKPKKPNGFKEKISRRLRLYMIELFLLMVSAQGAVTPVLVHHFHRFSFSGFLANFIAIPLSGIIIYLGIGASVLGLISKSLAGFVNHINGIFLNLLDGTAHVFSYIPYISSPPAGLLGLLIPYIFIALYCEARFKPFGIVKILDSAQKFRHPIDNLKFILSSKRLLKEGVDNRNSEY